MIPEETTLNLITSAILISVLFEMLPRMVKLVVFLTYLVYITFWYFYTQVVSKMDETGMTKADDTMTKRPPPPSITAGGNPLAKMKRSCSPDTVITSYMKPNQPSAINLSTYNPDDEPTFGINDLVYDKSIDVPTILKPLLDSTAFQRLRGIKQLGPTELLYPGATHTRFAHCLGTFYVASSFLSALRKRYPDKISGVDQLCVCIAALYHDIGHGPLSHLFEHVWEQNHYHHEDMSIRLFDHVMDELKREKAPLMEYLSEVDLEFIREAIRPPKSDPNGNWIMKGRPEEKAFLYEFVNNTKSGLDVDKMDYILRDSKHCNFGTRFQLSALDRIIKHTYINEQNGRTELQFHSKVSSDIRALYEDRERLHQCVYRHRTVIAVEYELQEALRLAGPHFMVPGKDGTLVALKDATKDVEAFLKLDDYIITMISNSPNPALKPAIEVLNRIRKRQLMPSVAVIKLTRNEINERDLRRYLEERLPSIAAKCRFIACSFHGGLGVGNDPMSRIKFICRNGEAQITANEWQHSVWWYVFIDYATSKESDVDFESITNVLKSFCKTKNIKAAVSPLYKRNEDIENDNPDF